MRRALLGSVALAAVFGFCAMFVLADWMPGDGHKMHFPQNPDEEGWNVLASFGQPLADDWTCSEDGPVNEIHFWGSWFGGSTGTIDGFWITIYSDIPDPDVGDPANWSMPGNVLWSCYIPIGDVIVQHIIPDPQLWEGWFDPTTGTYTYPDHDNYYQYNIFNIPDPFVQTAQTIYWLEITADTDIDDPGSRWGWKSSVEHHLDDAVYGIPTCTAPDNGSGTVDLPAMGCDYVGQEPMMIIDGLPPGTTIEMEAFFTGYGCGGGVTLCSGALPPDKCEDDGGSLGGHYHCFWATLDLTVSGTGELEGFNRHLAVPVEFEIHTGPRVPPDPCQEFDIVVHRLQGELFGDPDFCTFRVKGGNDYGLPSPGHMTISEHLDDPDWWVESFFDVTYQIEFEGCPGSQLSDYAGTTTATARFDQGGMDWQEMYEPGTDADTVFNAFFVEFDETGMLVAGDGENAYGEGWYYYPMYDWWNIWFYDHPYDPERYKEAFIEFDAFPRIPGPSYIELAINWSTDLWSIEQPPGDSMPPLPGVNEDLYIGREVLFVMQDPEGHYVFPWIWPEYNPEWVSIDVRGFNFIIPEGIVMHACVGTGGGESMDLSFVINSQPTGACCDPLTGDCYVTTLEGCVGDYQGDGTTCDPNPCPQPTGACCNPVTGGCTITTEASCAGDWQGAWTTCDPNPCPQPTGACCDPLGQCYVTERATCLGAGHEYHGDWTTCSGDLNGNGMDDRCEDLYWEPGDGHKMHYPQLPDESGWDVNGTLPLVLADDWMCSETGPVKDIHWWGSWKDGFEHQLNGFALSIHRDIPADPPQIPWSRPGEIIWQKVVTDFNPQQINPFTLEGWYDPLTQLVLPDNHSQYFQYNVYLDEEDWFMQDSGTIYWLNITAGVEGVVDGFWGWKTSIEHFNDDGVWGVPTCTEPDNGGGTITLPADCNFIGDEPMMIIDGLPPGTTIELGPIIQAPFTCQHDYYPCSLPLAQGVCEGPGGSLGGDGHCFEATLDLSVTGTGELTGFNRHLAVYIGLEIHTALRTPGDDLQSFNAMVYRLQGELFGDPDFCTFRVYGGMDFGLPSPGHITLAKLPNGTFQVESFFDITYQIEFEGCPGSVLDGYAGTTTATARFHQGGTDWVELLDPASGESLDLAFVITGGEESCCIPPIRGNVDYDPGDIIDISDLVYLVDYMFTGGPAPVCIEEADMDCSNGPSPIDIADLVYLVDYMFNLGPVPCRCDCADCP